MVKSVKSYQIQCFLRSSQSCFYMMPKSCYIPCWKLVQPGWAVCWTPGWTRLLRDLRVSPPQGRVLVPGIWDIAHGGTMENAIRVGMMTRGTPPHFRTPPYIRFQRKSFQNSIFQKSSSKSLSGGFSKKSSQRCTAVKDVRFAIGCRG